MESYGIPIMNTVQLYTYIRTYIRTNACDIVFDSVLWIRWNNELLHWNKFIIATEPPQWLATISFSFFSLPLPSLSLFVFFPHYSVSGMSMKFLMTFWGVSRFSTCQKSKAVHLHENSICFSVQTNFNYIWICRFINENGLNRKSNDYQRFSVLFMFTLFTFFGYTHTHT